MALEFLVDDLFPTKEVHLIAGPSGGGKTTFLFNMIRQWQNGQPVLNHASHPKDFYYISLDRSEQLVRNRMEAEGIDPDTIPHLSLRKSSTWEKVLSIVPATTKVLFIDGFSRLCPGGKPNDYNTVADFLAKLGDYCVEKDITIIGVVHATKVKEGESFLHARHRILGSVAWGAYSATLLFIDEVNPESNTNQRKVEILPRTAAPEEHFYTLNEKGAFVLTTKEEVAKVQENPTEIQFLFSLPLDTPIRASELMEMAQLAGISRSAIYRTIQEWVDAGVMGKAGRGEYVRKSSATLREGGKGAQGKT